MSGFTKVTCESCFGRHGMLHALINGFLTTSLLERSCGHLGIFIREVLGTLDYHELQQETLREFHRH